MLTPEQKEIAERVSKEMYPNLPLYITVPLIERFLAALPPAVSDDMLLSYQTGFEAGKRAAPQPADDVVRDAERIDWLEKFRERGVSRGFAWDSFTIEMGKSVREQIDAAMAKEKA